MTPIALDPSFDLLWAPRARTAFERNVLPGFAEWFRRKLDNDQPDLLVPVETKGARVLERTIDYIRGELGGSARVPMLYAPALAYVPPADLARMRVMLVDDAVRSGLAMERHSQRVKSYGVTSVQPVACIGNAELAGRGRADSPGLERSPGLPNPPRVSCYQWVSPQLYGDYVWQIAEMVVSRGLPPEVDHHVFQLQFSGRLPDVWASLADALRHYGTLTADGPLTTNEEIVSMTLHFPRLPGVPRYPLRGPVRDEGIRKIRLFADIPANAIHLVPITFPALDLPPGSDTHLPLPLCHELLRRWTGPRSTVGDLLVEEAHTRKPETLFRALSTVAEIDLVRGLGTALLLAGIDDATAITTEREVFLRLYGPDAGPRVADAMDAAVASVFHSPQLPRVTSHSTLQADAGVAPRQLDSAVITQTQRVARYLKILYERRASQEDFDPLERVGLSFSEIGRRVPPHKPDRLLTSRCVDYGLAMTTLVPYTDIDAHDDGSTTVLRKYRVSEILRGDEPFADIDVIRREVDEEAVALIARYLADSSTRYAGRAIPETELSQIVAILRPVVLARQGLTLRTRPADGGPELVVGSPARKQSIYDGTSQFFTFTSEGVRPSPRFEEWYASDNELRLDLRDLSALLESHLESLVAVLDDADDVKGLLLRWAMSADSRLGLTYVHRDLSQAIHRLQQPLVEILGGTVPDPLALVEASDEGQRLADTAEVKSRALSVNWAEGLRTRLNARRTKREIRLLRSLAAPVGQTQVYRLPTALSEIVGAAAKLLAPLAVWAGDVRDETFTDTSPDPPLELCAELARHAAQIRRALTSLDPDGGTVALAGAETDSARLAVHQFRLALLVLQSFSAATAWTYQGELRGREPIDLGDSDEKTILFADLSKSFVRGASLSPHAGFEWKDTGLNLIAQWAKAFGGREFRDRGGDDIWLAFDEPDAAVLCAAALQQHAAALRSTKIDSIWWAFHVALDTGRISEGTSKNFIGSCIDRAAKLAKKLDDETLLARVLVTPDTARQCTPSLREGLLMPMTHDVDLAPELAGTPWEDFARFRPLVLDPNLAMQRLADQISAVAASLRAAVPERSDLRSLEEAGPATEIDRSASSE
jgi:hypothetical protein